MPLGSEGAVLGSMVVRDALNGAPTKERLTAGQIGRELLVVAICVLSVATISIGFVNWSFIASFSLSTIWTYYPALMKGLGLTIGLTAVAMMVATVLSIALAVAAQSRRRSVRALITFYVEVFRSVPILVTLFWVHFALPLATGLKLEATVSGLIAMILQAGAFMTDVMRAGIAAVPQGQNEAARALGLSSLARWRLVVLPQALRVMLPSITNVLVSMLKASTILSALSVAQLWQVAQQIGSYTFKPLEALTVAAIMYYAIGKLITFAMRQLERRLRLPG